MHVHQFGQRCHRLIAPSEIHIGRLSRLPLTIFKRTGVAGHLNLARHHLVYCDVRAAASIERTIFSVNAMS